MKKHHLSAYYCTLLVPVGALAGIGLGRAINTPVSATVLGVLLGIFCSFLLLWSDGSRSFVH